MTKRKKYHPQLRLNAEEKPGRSDVPTPWPASTEPLDRAEEMALLRRWKNAGDTAARDRVIQANIRFTVSVAVQFQGCGLPLRDLVTEGILGMMVAIDRFDPERGFKFITYAVWWIKQKITYAIHRDHLVRLPDNFKQTLYQYRRREQAALSQGQDPDQEKIVREMKLTKEQEKGLEVMTSQIISIDVFDSLHDDNGDYFKDFTPSFLADFSTLIKVNEKLERTDRQKKVTDALAGANLDDRERLILTRRFGLDRKPAETLEEIGLTLGLTRERVRQIQVEIFEKIQKIPALKAAFKDIEK